MSKVNIRRTVENIRANTTVYSPIVEVVVNAIPSIESSARQDGKITLRIQRTGQIELDGDLPEIKSFEIAAKPIREIPRLCRGGSRSLTFHGVHRGNY